MISQINITVNAAKPKFPLSPMVAFNGSPSSVRISGVPCSIGDWSINNVRVLVSYPNNFTVEKTAVKVDNFWIATIDGSQINGVIKNGFQVIADGVDENGLSVNGYVLGVGDVVVLPRDKGIEKLVDRYAVRYLNEPPVNPSIGDMLNLNGQFKVWDGSKWVSVSGEDIEVYDSTITLQANGVEIDSFTVNASEAKIIDIPVPSKTSELDNDSGFITSAAIPSKVSELDNDVGYVTAEAIPSKVSELDNDAGYITMSAIPAIPSTTSDLDNDSGFITASAIPSQISSFENDVGYITASQVQPYSAGGFQGYARNALGTIFVFGRDSTGMSPNENVYATFDISNGKLARAEQTYYPWLLSMYNGTTFDPPLEMTYGYRGTVAYKANGRVRSVQVNSNCWFAMRTVGTTTTPYYIKAVEDEYGQIQPDENFYTTATAHPITFSQDTLSIETIDGESGNITCTRQGTGTHIISQNYYAYEDAIPSNVSQLTNDAGYITASAIPPIPSNTSDLTNDSGFITASAIPSNLSSFNNDVGYLSAVTWNDVSGKPNIPSNTSDLNNDSGFITSAALSGYATENYVDGKVLALSSIYALDSDLDLVVASVSSIQTSLSTYATISYVDSQIGSINTILDNINGEVI